MQSMNNVINNSISTHNAIDICQLDNCYMTMLAGRCWGSDVSKTATSISMTKYISQIMTNLGRLTNGILIILNMHLLNIYYVISSLYGDNTRIITSNLIFYIEFIICCCTIPGVYIY